MHGIQDKQDDIYHSLQVTPEQMKAWQESDSSLKKLRAATKDPHEGYTATFFTSRISCTVDGHLKEKIDMKLSSLSCQFSAVRSCFVLVMMFQQQVRWA